jgi:hypothetical protein
MTPKTCYRIGAVLLLSGLFHLSVLVFSGDTWSGPLSWRKPATFGLSFGLTLITIAWAASYLPVRRWLLGAFAVACAGEVVLITVQAWRRVPSHFNMETPLDTAVSRVLAAGGGVIIVVIVAMTVVAFRPLPSVAPSMRLALRAGFLSLDTALAIGAVMIAIGVTDVAGGDQPGAYAVGAQWKPAHFVPMHGVLALPVLAWLLSRTTLPERSRLRIVTVAAAGYAVLCALAVVESIAGVDPLRAPPAADAVAVLAVLAVLVAAVQTLAAPRYVPNDQRLPSGSRTANSRDP